MQPPLTDPSELLNWISEQDQAGVVAIVVDDDTKVYYCNSADTFNDYAAKGKKVSLFYYLAQRLRKEQKPKQGGLFEGGGNATLRP